MSEVELSPDGLTYGFSITTSGGEDATAAVDAAYGACTAEHLNTIESEYLSGLELTGAERESAYAEFVECLEAADVDTVVVGDDEGTITSKISAVEKTGLNVDEAWLCQQKYIFPIFGG
ncbi:hypothetical protein [Antribacter gilvus]|uniref:hypothetical protein n=1 Tax=Antribacter gilvus TaxID=2304675 RepID=UPI000F77152F|nr:hypothetical protein [Antribacter gilvus]